MSAFIFQQKWTILYKQNGVFKPFMGLNNFTLNFCDYLASGGVKAMMMDIMFKNMKKHTNLFNGCPFKVNFKVFKLVRQCELMNVSYGSLQGHYYVKSFQIDDADFPHVFRAGEYRFILLYYLKEKDTFLFRLELAMRLKAKSFTVS